MMKLYSILLGVAISAGCDSDSTTQITDLSPAQELNGSEILTGGAGQEIMAAFSGASFASVDPLAGTQTVDGETELSSWRVTFTADTVTWARNDVLEVGSYSGTDESALLAQFANREIAFEADGGNLIWDSVEYLRTAKSQFDSQESLVGYLDGARFDTIEQFDIGENSNGELVLGYWSLSISGDEASWAVQDTVSVGNYTYVNDSEFQINLFNQPVTAVVLDGGSLLINSVIYERALVSQFDSQETLISFLSEASYRSVDLKSITGVNDLGAMGNGLGYWFVDFLDNTMTWSYRGMSQVGNVEFLDGDTFTVVFADASHTVNVENDDIIFDGTRYSRVSSE